MLDTGPNTTIRSRKKCRKAASICKSEQKPHVAGYSRVGSYVGHAEQLVEVLVDLLDDVEHLELLVVPGEGLRRAQQQQHKQPLAARQCKPHFLLEPLMLIARPW